jgi:hypothetical protein
LRVNKKDIPLAHRNAEAMLLGENLKTMNISEIKKILQENEVIALTKDYSELVEKLGWNWSSEEETLRGNDPNFEHTRLEIRMNSRGPVLIGHTENNDAYTIAEGWDEFGGEDGLAELVNLAG